MISSGYNPTGSSNSPLFSSPGYDDTDTSTRAHNSIIPSWQWPSAPGHEYRRSPTTINVRRSHLRIPAHTMGCVGVSLQVVATQARTRVYWAQRTSPSPPVPSVLSPRNQKIGFRNRRNDLIASPSAIAHDRPHAICPRSASYSFSLFYP